MVTVLTKSSYGAVHFIDEEKLFMTKNHTTALYELLPVVTREIVYLN